MAQLTPEQRRTRERFEAGLRLAAPALNVLLAAGERLSRIVERDDHEYYPPRPAGGEPEPPPAVAVEGDRSD